MLRLQNLESLAEIVQIDQGDLRLIAEFADNDIRPLRAWSPGKKPRDVIAVGGKLRQFQERFYHRFLKKRLRPTPYSFGAVRGRGILSNAKRHSGNTFVFKADISSFFPSISTRRVNRLFMQDLRCSPEVSRILTRLCTAEHHLALGLVTSPALADQVVNTIDVRCSQMCRKSFDATYSRFVDDITISAPYDLRKTSIARHLRSILRDSGFQSRADKETFGRLDEGLPITGVRIKKDRFDASKEFIGELQRQLKDHLSLGEGGAFKGPLYSESQLRGRVLHAVWLNPSRCRQLLKDLSAISWQQVNEIAKSQGYLSARVVLTDRDSPPPTWRTTPVAPAEIPEDDSCPFE